MKERKYKSKLILDEKEEIERKPTIYDMIEKNVNERPRAALYRESEKRYMD